MSSAAVASTAGLRIRPTLVPERERAIGDMQAFLARVHPQTPAEALRLLRNAYPEAALSLRVAACGLNG
ncbi:hypothetical protein [Hansschlegelia plantiphila]|uniref:Uncharacterized protein n=1 Tax=Hansschlegelia plantiphila TaxID=374655 RepID=A0A9W6IYL6_9HYPH|nr:hypothetical protein [Hansschlegelia plantiphila]GLK67531.1 hypothetical protein GCM10008179_11690 [Hansschlegelia plantiphila]